MAYYEEANKMAAIVNADMLFEPTLEGQIQDQGNVQVCLFFFLCKTATEMHFKAVVIYIR